MKFFILQPATLHAAHIKSQNYRKHVALAPVNKMIDVSINACAPLLNAYLPDLKSHKLENFHTLVFFFWSRP